MGFPFSNQQCFCATYLYDVYSLAFSTGPEKFFLLFSRCGFETWWFCPYLLALAF